MANSVRVFESYYRATENLKPEDFKALWCKIFGFAFDGEEKGELGETPASLYTLIKPTIEKSISISEKRAASGKKGGEANKKQKESKPKPKPKQKDPYSDNPALDEAIRNFIAHRKAMKKPMTPRAIELFIKRLGDLAQTADEKIALIDLAIRRGWQDVYENNEVKKPKNEKIHNFQERGYDFAALEKKLVKN